MGRENPNAWSGYRERRYPTENERHLMEIAANLARIAIERTLSNQALNNRERLLRLVSSPCFSTRPAGATRLCYTIQVRAICSGIQMGMACPRELLFMAVLCEREALGHSEVGQVQQGFLAAHLLRWAPGFCADVIAHTAEPFYRGLALLTQGFIEQELQNFARADQ